MGLALALGDRNLGLTWPNPSVGAVLVSPRSNLILTQAATDRGGRPHAERIALADIGELARGSTLYVSLEPCSHHGRTPPCVDAIVEAGVVRVVTALEDPDPRVAGRGHAALRAAGIDVESGIGSAQAARSHRGHVSRVTRGRPWLTLKLARTGDGYAGRRGERLMITGDAANAHAHMLRAHTDAVMVGVSTVMADDPRLDVRLPGLEARSPLRIVLDSALRIPRTAQLVTSTAAGPTWIMCSEAAPIEAENRLRDLGIEVIRVEADEAGRVRASAALEALGSRGVTRVICEGGPSLADVLAGEDLIDDMILITARTDLRSSDAGLAAALPAIGPSLRQVLDGGFRLVESVEAGADRIETFERIAPCSPAS